MSRVLQSLGLRRVRHDFVTEQQQQPFRGFLLHVLNYIVHGGNYLINLSDINIINIIIIIVFLILPRIANRTKMFKHGNFPGMNETSFSLSRLKIIHDLYNRLLNSCLTHTDTHTLSISSLKSDTGFFFFNCVSAHGKCHVNIQVFVMKIFIFSRFWPC